MSEKTMKSEIYLILLGAQYAESNDDGQRKK